MQCLTSIKSCHIEELVDFLYTIKWVFSTLNTHYLLDNVLSDNKDFFSNFDNLSEKLSAISELIPTSEYSDELNGFIIKVRSLAFDYELVDTDFWNNKKIKKLSPKKKYEIENLSLVVNDICKNETTQFIDFGSGLGYLSQYLYDQFDYEVLGLDGSLSLVTNAQKRQEKDFPQSIGKVKYLQHFINERSSEFLSNNYGIRDENLAIIGLHGCGDLTVTAMKLFFQKENVKQLIFMPCCYHKMSTNEEDPTKFNNFPLSEKLKSKLQNYSNFLNRSFLRLAGQQSPTKWREMNVEEHWIHGKNMFERALAEAMLSENETLKRVDNTCIHEGRVKFEDITSKYILTNNQNHSTIEWTEEHREKFKKLRQNHPNGEEQSESLFCLQTMIQKLCENLVVIDRINYMQEQAKKLNLSINIKVKKLSNDKLSPRCLIFIAEKVTN
ncbi:unnamed protein product [Diamesa hyperborea]